MSNAFVRGRPTETPRRELTRVCVRAFVCLQEHVCLFVTLCVRVCGDFVYLFFDHLKMHTCFLSNAAKMQGEIFACVRISECIF